jgi:hypothetical protein
VTLDFDQPRVVVGCTKELVGSSVVEPTMKGVSWRNALPDRAVKPVGAAYSAAAARLDLGEHSDSVIVERVCVKRST